MMRLNDGRNLVGKLSMALRVLCLLSLSSTCAESSERIPDDFYKGAELGTPVTSPFYRIILPESVYQESASPDLRDIRVFNASGQAVTFAQSQVDTVQVEQKSVALRMFPMKMSAGKQEDITTLKSANGIEISLAHLARGGNGQPAVSYLLQTESDRESLNQIVLSWQQKKENWRSTARVFSSSDLKNWHEQADKAPLMDLVSGEERLLLNHIDLNVNGYSRRERYRLLIIDGAGHAFTPRLTKAEGFFITRKARTESIDLTFKVRSSSKNEAVYELTNAQPLTALSVVPLNNALLPVNIEYRSGSQGQWHALVKDVVYLVGTEHPLALNNMLVKQIRIKAVKDSDGWGKQLPEIIGKRNRVDVIFNAQGNPPYLLTWGSNQVESAPIPVEQLIPPGEMPPDGLDSLPTASVNHIMVLGGEERVRTTTPAWLLWGLLIIGVGVLALIVFKLAREVMGSRPE